MGRSPKFEAGAIEFSSDGIRDSLTSVLAPARFFEILQAELAMAIRDQRSLTLISLRNLKSSTGGAQELDVNSIHQSLKSMAEHLLPLLRSGDQIARISEDGFWILIRAGMSAAMTASERFFSNPIEESGWRMRFCEIEAGEAISSWIRRMDGLHFSG